MYLSNLMAKYLYSKYEVHVHNFSRNGTSGRRHLNMRPCKVIYPPPPKKKKIKEEIEAAIRNTYVKQCGDILPFTYVVTEKNEIFELPNRRQTTKSII